MGEHGESLAEPDHADGHRADVKTQEGPTDVGPPRLTRDDTAHADHPSGKRYVLSPLAGRYPGSREQPQREEHAKISRVEEVLSAQSQDELGNDCDDHRDRMDPPGGRAQQQRHTERSNDRATERMGRAARDAFAKVLAAQTASKGKGNLRRMNAEVAQVRSGRQQKPEEQDLRQPWVDAGRAQKRSDSANPGVGIHPFKAFRALNGIAARACRKF